MARRAEAPLYIVHLSCAEALEAVAEAKARGEPVYAETCPHYLTFTDALYADPDEAEVIKRVISPPLRTAADVDALWAGLRDGILDVVGSDHVPDRLDTEKRLPAPPFPEISNGAPGIETLLSVVYSEGVADGPDRRRAHGRRARRRRRRASSACRQGRDRGRARRRPRAVGPGGDVGRSRRRTSTTPATSRRTRAMPVAGVIRDVLVRGRRPRRRSG